MLPPVGNAPEILSGPRELKYLALCGGAHGAGPTGAVTEVCVAPRKPRCQAEPLAPRAATSKHSAEVITSAKCRRSGSL
eukprot:8191660-Alexandrium_andersonii.AAC.1